MSPAVVSSAGRLESPTAALWNAFGDQTIERLADGSRTLAVLWQLAWKQGSSEGIAKNKIVAQSQEKLMEVYNDKTFAPNAWLKDQGITLDVV